MDKDEMEIWQNRNVRVQLAEFNDVVPQLWTDLKNILPDLEWTDLKKILPDLQ